MKAMMTVIVALTFSFSAFADQCQVLTQDQMSQALGALKAKQAEAATSGNTLYVAYFCQPCGDTFPSFVPVSQLGNKKWTMFGQNWEDNKLWEVTINGKAVDAAYVYYNSTATNAKTGKQTNQFVNLAKSTTCSASGVSDYLNVAYEGQPTW